MGIERLLFQRPEAERLSVERTPVEGSCPECGSELIARYPVANYLGPRIVTKCQACFYHLSTDVPSPEDNWPPWRSATADWLPSRAG